MLTRRAALMAASLLLAAPAGRLRAQGRPLVFLGDRDLPPYSFLEGGAPQGASVDLAKAIGRVLGRPVEVRLMDWAEAQARLLAGEGDALSLLARTPGRQAQFDFSQPTMPGNTAFFVRAGQEREFAMRDQLPGWRIAVTRGGLARELLGASHPEAEIVPVAELGEAIALLRRGAVDAVAGSAWAVRRLLLQQGATGIAELPPFARRSGNVAVRKGETVLLAEIDAALSAVKQSGEFDAILNRWARPQVHVVPDWMVRTALGVAATGAVGLAGLGALALRLRRRTAALTREIQERNRAEAALADSRERLAVASAAAELGVWDVDVASRTAIVNREFRRLYGLPPDDEAPLSQAAWLARIHPDDRARLRDVARWLQAQGGEYREEYRVVRADTGEVRWLGVRGSTVGPPGAVRRVVGVCMDITERRLEQERQLLLAREVDHRARNVLAVVQSVVRLTRAEDSRDFAEAVEGRVAALARAHTLLSRDRWTGADMAELVREELAAYDRGASVEIAGPALRLEAGAVQPLSMVMHELATNAAKYGALSLAGGRVRVDWSLHPAQDGGTKLCLRWLERDGPPVLVKPFHRGFGSSLISATVRGQLGGRIEQHWEAEGLRCEIELPGTVLAPGGAPEPVVEAAVGDPPAAPLYGRRVLLVEDEPLVALALQSVLQDAGCTVRGPVASLAEAQRLGAEEGLDAAVMDVNVRGGVSVPLGERLAGRGVPVVYVTGFGTLPGGRAPGPGETVLQKPVRERELVEALARAIGAARALAEAK